MFPKERMFLSGVSYNERKRQVVASFTGSHGSARFRYHFNPKAHFRVKVDSGELKRTFSGVGIRNLDVSVGHGVATVTAQDFSTLNVVCETASLHSGMPYFILPPERQFLIGKGWDYFDSFSFRNGEPEPENSFEFPDARLAFFSGSLRETLSALAKSNPGIAAETAGKVAMSRVLKVPPHEAPQLGLATRVFLENIMFSCSMPIYAAGSVQAPETASLDMAGIDFSGLLSVVASHPSNNLGFESLDCACCCPASADSKNVLPSSTVNVRFLREGFYFNPVSAAWAEMFHSSSQSKAARASRKEEFRLPNFPAGPFSRGETCHVLLADALRLRDSGEAEIVSHAELHWSCARRQSGLSLALSRLREALDNLSSAAESEIGRAVASAGLVYYTSASQPLNIYHSALLEVISAVLAGVPRLLCAKEDCFFDHRLAVALECIAGGVARELEQSASCNGYRVAAPSFATVLAGREEAHSVFRCLSSLCGVGKPYIKFGGWQGSHF